MENLPKVGRAILQSLLKILYFVFVWPFTVWLKAVGNVADCTDNRSLDLSKIHSRYPLLTFFKRFFMEFLFDAIVVLIYPVGVIVAFYYFFITVGYSFEYAIKGWFGALVSAYYAAVYVSVIRDLVQLLIVLPLVKFLSWLNRPAQYLELDNKVIKKED